MIYLTVATSSKVILIGSAILIVFGFIVAWATYEKPRKKK